MSRSKKNQPIRVLIDGYNLIFTCGLHGRHRNPASLAQARLKLERAIRQNVPTDELMAIWIVYDSAHGNAGSDETSGEGPVATFAGDFEDADAMIEALIARSSIPKSLIVVSADHRIQVAARRRDCQVIDSEDWYDRLLSGRFAETSFDLEGRSKPGTATIANSPDGEEATCVLMDPAEIQELLEDVQQLENIDLLDPELAGFDDLDEFDASHLDIDEDPLGFE